MSAKNTEATNMTMIRSTVSTPTSKSTSSISASRDRSAAGRLLGGALLVGVLAAVALLAGWAERQGEAGRARATSPRVLGGAIDAPVQVGETLEVAVRVEGAEALAAFEATLRYDPSIVLPTAVRLGDFAPADSTLLQTGRPSDGSLAIGSYNAAGQTASGAGVLAIVTFEVLAGGQAQIDLERGTTTAFGSVGQPLRAAITLRVSGGPIYLPRLANGGE
jgi:hypothetical protein